MMFVRAAVVLVHSLMDRIAFGLGGCDRGVRRKAGHWRVVVTSQWSLGDARGGC